jgi:hypothetical protein
MLGRFSRRLPQLIWPALALAPFLTGCRKPKPPVVESDAVCRARVAEADEAQAEGASLDPALWTSILVANYDRVKQTTSGPGKDCRGALIEYKSAPQSLGCPKRNFEFPATHAQANEATAIEAPLSEGAFLLWTPVSFAQNGDALGPLAFGQWTPNGVDILALGTIAAHLNRATLRLESAQDTTLIAIESDRCDSENSTCTREIALFVQDGDRIVTPALVQDDGRCVGEPVFLAHRKQSVKIAANIERTFELQSSLQNGPAGLSIQEQVTVVDRDLNTPDAPPRPFREASLSRQLRVSPQKIAIQAGLWENMLHEHGSVRPEDAPQAQVRHTGASAG